MKPEPTAAQLSSIRARRVWDSRGNPTVQVSVQLAGGAWGRAIAPAAASRGTREATDLRDGGKHLNGMDVSRAVNAVNTRIADALMGMDGTAQQLIDEALIALDGSPLKSNLGGNAIVATSLAVLHAAAASRQLPLWQYLSDVYDKPAVLPLPEIQIFGGGAHAGHRVDVQDFMIMVPGASSFDEALEISAKVYHAAGKLMADQGKLAGVADEGGWWPMFDNNEQALQMLVQAIELAGETPGDRVVISLDIAASQFGGLAPDSRSGRYRLALEERELDSDALSEMLGRWLDHYPIVSIEDPLAENDTAGMSAFTRAYGDHVQIIGDDYLVTNEALVNSAITDGACNAVLIKVNQAGTVTESLNAMSAAQRAGWTTIVSARSGETEDVSISHLATGLNAGQLKVGSFARSERMAKWNECLRIGDEMAAGGTTAPAFAAGKPLHRTAWGRRHLAPY